MKIIIYSVLLLCLTQGVMAQEKVMVITPVKNGEEPFEVMEAIRKDFPNAISKDLAFLPSKMYGDEWNVEVNGDALDNVKFYQVNLVQGKSEYVAIYDQYGKLLSSEQIVRDSSLPPPVSATVKKFKGWHIDKAHEIIRYRNHKTTDTYKVKLQKGAEHKTVFIDPKGEIINTRYVLF